MSGPLRTLALPALLALLAIALLWPQEPRGLTADSFGIGPGGFRALYQLLDELDLEVQRSYRPVAQLDPQATLWWIAPRGLCGTGSGDDGAQEPASKARDPAGLRGWVEAGGTAVVALASPERALFGAGGDELEPGCTRLAGEPLPPRSAASTTAADPAPQHASPTVQEDASTLERWQRGELGRRSSADFVAQQVSGSLVPRPRRLHQPPLHRFEVAESGAGQGEPAPGFEVVARVDGAPFALARGLGAGRLVVIADAAFLENRHLAEGDAAPLALDLVRAYGIPALDERAHGLRRETRPHVYLAGSRALPVFLGLVLTGILVLGLGAALPPREVAELDPAAPQLARFVDSLATLYARNRDYPRLDASHRAMSLARLRRHLGLPPETGEDALRARLERSGRLAERELDALFDDEPARSAAMLRTAARRRDALVEEIAR